MKKTLCTISAFAFALFGLAQTNNANVIFHSVAIDSLTTLNTLYNYSQISLEGYRIQIYSGSGPSAKSDYQNAKNQVLTSFPAVRTYGTYNAPSWRVRVGDFRYRSEALPLFNKLRLQFPSCYIVRDKDIKKKTFVE